nr:hypothetical protein [Tanacetum cinerariifolium]
MTYPKEVDGIIRIPIEVEPLDHMKLDDLGLNTCSHDLFPNSREFPSVDDPEPQPLPNLPFLDVNLGDKRGTDPPINPYSSVSFRMKVVEPLAIHTPPSTHVAYFHRNGVYRYYHSHLTLSVGISTFYASNKCRVRLVTQTQTSAYWEGFLKKEIFFFIATGDGARINPDGVARPATGKFDFI